MKIRNLLRRAGYAVFGLALTGGVAFGALSFSTGTGFIPGPRLIDGTDLNVMVSAVNTLITQAAGTVAGAYTGTFNGTVGATTPSTGAFTTVASSGTATMGSGVNQVVITGAATGTAASVTEGGAGADANRDFSVAAAGTGIVALGQTRATCSGTTTATCQGQRFTASVTGLSTASGGVSATAMTVTNASVASSAVGVICNVNGYSGTGQPIATNVTPGTGQVSFQVTNIASSGSLNATVPVYCTVF